MLFALSRRTFISPSLPKIAKQQLQPKIKKKARGGLWIGLEKKKREYICRGQERDLKFRRYFWGLKSKLKVSLISLLCLRYPKTLSLGEP